MCQELKLAEQIDALIPYAGKVSYGQAVVAMIINGLGFTTKALYLTPDFFKDKPIERLIGSGIEAEHLHDDVLGRALDAIYQFNPTTLYSHLAKSAVSTLGLKSRSAHLDSTSFHVDGAYAAAQPGTAEAQSTQGQEEDKRSVIHITQGYSRDHRPDLNQVILNLIVEHQAGIPVFMELASGNSSDKTNFGRLVSEHVKQLQSFTGIEYTIADSALYTQDNLQRLSEDHLFITRVPETTTQAKAAIQQASEIPLTPLGESYHYAEVISHYGGVEQRWVVIKSQAAWQRERQRLHKQLTAATAAELKSYRQLAQQTFRCAEDAKAALATLQQQLQLLEITQASIVAEKRYAKRGKPGKNTHPDQTIYRVSGYPGSRLGVAQAKEKQLGFFILATNDLDQQRLSPAQLLAEYKGQSRVERGFRFLKSPYFMTASLFLKNATRIMALLMVMTLCLMVYAAIEYRIRQALIQTQQTFPNQKGKPISNPTARWVFECFTGIHLLILHQAETVQQIILNLQERHRMILTLLGQHYQKIYS